MMAYAVSVKKITSQIDCWIISDGRNSGTSKFLGKTLLQLENSGDCHQELSPIFLCATHWGSVKQKELLFGISLPRERKCSKYFYYLEYKLAKKESYGVLNPYQEAYLFLDNGRSQPYDCAQKFRRKFEKFIKDEFSKSTYCLEDVKLPVVTLVIGGDEHTLDEVLHSVQNRKPVIVMNESGDVPNLLSELFYHLESCLPRTWNETPGWTNREKIAFNSFLTKYDTKISRVCNKFMSNDLTRSKTTFEQIMKNRYYITVLDSSFENDEGLLCSMLKGIYKGYSRQSALAVALKTGTYDFLQALFYREFDPQFMKEHYLNVWALNIFYQEILCSETAISKVLQLMCKWGSCPDKIDKDISVLPAIGRILQLLLGPRYKLLYHEKIYSDFTEGTLFQNRKQQIWHLFFWSVLNAKPEMTQFFLLHSSAPLGAALLAFKLYSNLATHSSKVHEEELTDLLNSAASQFQKAAIEILDKMYNMDTDEAYRVLISELPFDLGPRINPLTIADDSMAKDFISHSCCQTYLQKVWKGSMAMETPLWKLVQVLTPFLAIPWVHFDDSICKIIGKKSKPIDTKSPILWKIKSFYTAPVTKFYTRMGAYLCFLGTISYFVLTDLRPFTSAADISPAEWIVIVWEISFIIEELVQMFFSRESGPLTGMTDITLSSTIWHSHEKFRLRCYWLEIYVREGQWNSVDTAMVALFIVSFSLRFALPLETFQLARISFACTIIVSYFRLLWFWYVFHRIGPRIIAIKMMLAELMKFLLVLAVFVLGFGVAFQAILNPNQSPSWTTFADILWRPYWEMFGELFLDDGPGMGRDVGKDSCVNMAEAEQIHGNSSSSRIQCYEWAAPVLLGIYLLISTVLLLNLLIAIFSQTFEEVNSVSHKVWLYNLYNLTKEFYYQAWLPPPLSLFIHLYRFICFIKKRHRLAELRGKEDCFRLSPLPASHDLQKKAIKAIKQFCSRT